MKIFISPILTLKTARNQEKGLGYIVALLGFEWFLRNPREVVEHAYRLLDSPLSGLLVGWNGFVRFAMGPALLIFAMGTCLYYLSRHRKEKAPKLWGAICAVGYAWSFHTFLLAALTALLLVGISEPFAHLNALYEFEPLLGLGLETLPVAIPVIIAFGPHPEVSDQSIPQVSSGRKTLILSVVTAAGLLATLATVQHIETMGESAKPLVSQEPLPNFELVSLDNKNTLHSHDLKGSVVLIDVWATWCGPCIATMPYLDELYKELEGTDFKLVSMNVEPHNLRAVHALLAEKQFSFPVYVDQGRAQEALKIRMFPTMVLVDRQGIIRKVHTGITSIAGLEGEIRQLLDNP